MLSGWLYAERVAVCRGLRLADCVAHHTRPHARVLGHQPQVYLPRVDPVDGNRVVYQPGEGEETMSDLVKLGHVQVSL